MRGRVKFRVGRIVYVAFSRDETVMGFGVPEGVARRARRSRSRTSSCCRAAPTFATTGSIVRMDAIDEAEMRELVLDAWAMVVPKGVAGGLRRLERAGGRGCVDSTAVAALVTTVVGSYPQPDWLIDRERLGERLPPRVRARELWRVPEQLLEEAQDDATRLAVADMERAGVDVITDGEMRRESYSNRFATALEGVDLDEPGRRARPHGPREPRAAGRRPGPPHPAGRGPRRRVPALDHRAPHQDHRARAVHDDAPGPGRPLRATTAASRSRTPTP